MYILFATCCIIGNAISNVDRLLSELIDLKKGLNKNF